MAFSEAEKASIRAYMGSTSRYVDDDSRLEAAMTALGDGGATEDLIRDTYLVRLAAIDAKLVEYETYMIAGQVDEVDIDAARSSMALRGIGRMWAKRLANALGFERVRTDCFSTSTAGDWQTDPSGLP